MLKIDGIKLPLDHEREDISAAVAKVLKVPVERLKKFEILRLSIDARKKPDIFFVYSMGVTLEGDEVKKAKRLKNKGVTLWQPPDHMPMLKPKNNYQGKHRPIVVGAGPAGIFAALTLARAGLEPLIVERGKRVWERQDDVENFWQNRTLNPNSNVQFGEGGAGAFSDGKLTTGTRDPRHRRIIADFIEGGAPREIEYFAKPHIGSDRLPGVVAYLRRLIESLGGEYAFSTQLTDFHVKDGALTAVELTGPQGKKVVECDHLILATGHSARDLYRLLYEKGVALAPKAFSLGVRIEHPQDMINRVQYGTDVLGAADYKLAVHLPDRRGVYTFCMCPGGVVVGAASEPNTVVTNGMSNYDRDGLKANSGLLVAVTPEDFPTDHVLGGMFWQEEIERRCFEVAGGNYDAPAQTVAGFLAHTAAYDFDTVAPTYLPGVRFCDLHRCLPPLITGSLEAALPLLDKKLPGFAMDGAVMTAPETRSSAPVRILRDSRGEANIKGIFPAGEGSGYAGGIMSAAADGMKISEFVLSHNG